MGTIKKPNFDAVGVMGDTHGDTLWVMMSVEKFADRGVTHILHLGDFGVWPGKEGETYLRKVNAELKAHGMIMVVTLGNHENYVRMQKAVPSVLMEDFQQLIGYDHIVFPARGQHWNWNGVEFCSLGGANSIDRFSRTPYIDWWPEESISLGDVYRTAENGPADIMLAHDCPSGVPILSTITHHSENAGWSPEALKYADESRMMLRQAVDRVKPDLLLHGHYHVYADFQVELQDMGTDEIYSMRSVCFDKEYTHSNLAILNPQDRQLTMYSDWPTLD